MEKDKIKCASLMNIAEAVRIEKEVLKYERWYWLLDSGNNKQVSYITPSGKIDEDGTHYALSVGKIRPVIIFEDEDAFVGQEITINDNVFDVVLPGVMLLRGDIGESTFSDIDNLYETSKVKKAIDSWYKKAVLPYLK